MRFLIGIDDTDNPRAASTGLIAQRLGISLQEASLGRLEAVTRHQLIISPQIPCTTHNSAICVTFEADAIRRSEIEMACRAFLLREYSSGANAGFALASWVQITPEIYTWARLAKTRVLDREGALEAARSAKISITGLTGNGRGIIGALAAIGLRYRGNDGRFLWLPNINELTGIYTYGELMQIAPFERVETVRGYSPRANEKIEISKWIRPILRDGRCVLLVEEERENPAFAWHLLGMNEVRKLSD